ncbi:MAG: hypothetical protein KG003_09285 [Bacteroidetes bacterium]|nr:hypothetical protein [Bacteroidota bacterium]
MALNHLPPASRIWMFGADRILSSDEMSTLHTSLQNFVNGWQAHGKDLSAGYEIEHSCMVVIAVDENAEAPSGCSIDKAFRLLEEFGATHQIAFFNRTNIYLKRENQVKIFSKTEAKDALGRGDISESDEILQTLHTNLKGYSESPYVRISESWLAKLPV